MSAEHTRREFLKLSGVGLAASAVTEAVGTGASPAETGSGTINVWVTDEKRRFDSLPPLLWRKSSTLKAGTETIRLNPQKKFQEILGFGAAFTDASCYMFSQLTEE